jgi:hypothetical protein
VRLKSAARGSELQHVEPPATGEIDVRPQLHNRILVTSLAGCAVLLAACADRSWHAVRERDTVSGYSKFLRSDPDSPHAEEARMRIEFLRVRAEHSVKTFEEFQRQYPDSPWLDELREEVEPLYFEQARLANTPDAYREFLAAFPDGALSRRALGNLVYIQEVRPYLSRERLDRFVQEYPDSDFVSEAQQSQQLIALRESTQIRKMGVQVEVAPNISQPQRVRKGFAAMVARKYAEMGIVVEPLASTSSPTPDMDAWARLDYEESQASGVFGTTTLVSRCRVRLYHRSAPSEPVWDQSFEAPAEHVLQGAAGRDKTVFNSSRHAFWSHFFVPVATWATSETRVGRFNYLEDVAAVDIVGERAALLFTRGGFDLLDVSRAGEPQVLERYRRDHDLSRWAGIRLAGESVVLLYGPDGAEVVERTSVKPKVIGRWELPEIGAVRSAQVFENTVLLASTRGIYAVRLEQRPLKAHRLLEGEFVGLEIRPPHIYLIAPDRIEVTAPKHLLRHLSGVRVSFEKGFGATRSRLIGSRLYVFGKQQVVRFALDVPSRPSVEARLDHSSLGEVKDVASDDQLLYVLGERGLQVAGPAGEWVADAIQLAATRQLTRKDHYLFAVGERTLEVLDIGPYMVQPPAAPAAPADDSTAP